MSSDGSIRQSWGDGEHTFRLRIGELRELEDKRNAGAFEIYQRLASGAWRVDDITETLRLGLIGGGMATHLALGYVAKYVRPTTFLENVVVARMVLMAALFGDPADIVGKAAAPSPEPSSQDEPSFRPTSAPAPQWDGRSTTSTEQAFGNSPRPLTDGNGAMAPANPKAPA